MVKICTCIKKNGEPCTYKAKPHSDYCGVHKNCKTDLKPVAKFTFLKTIAKGGFGKTSLVKENSSDQLFVMKQSLRSNKEEIIKQYNNLTEVEKLKSVLFVKPGIIASDKTYFTMEYLDGFTTLHYIFSEKIKIDHSIKKAWAMSLLEGISILHNAGIAHCDIKPLNIMVRGAQLKIIDFGISMMNTTSPTSISGTYLCMPPEMLNKLVFIDGKLYKNGKATFKEYCKYDLWATGLCLFILSSPDYTNPIPRDVQLLQKFYKNKTLSKPLIEKYSNNLKTFYDLPCLDVLSYSPSKRRLCLA